MVLHQYYSGHYTVLLSRSLNLKKMRSGAPSAGTEANCSVATHAQKFFISTATYRRLKIKYQREQISTVHFVCTERETVPFWLFVDSFSLRYFLIENLTSSNTLAILPIKLMIIVSCYEIQLLIRK